MALYNKLLKKYDNKGKFGKVEIFDSPEQIKDSIKDLFDHWRQARHVMILTGAGISTAAGVPDFRGPKGVWTLESLGLEAEDVQLETISPTFTHNAIVELEKKGLVQFVVSQNIDNLHNKSGFPSEKLAEVHGNIFMLICQSCKRKYLDAKPVLSVGFKTVPNRRCEGKLSGKPCRGLLRDNCLDWDDAIPQEDFSNYERHLSKCDLMIVLGTSLEIRPIGEIPVRAQERGAYVVTVNLQKTQFEDQLKHKIHMKVDDFFKQLMEHFAQQEIPNCPPSASVLVHVDEAKNRKRSALDSPERTKPKKLAVQVINIDESDESDNDSDTSDGSVEEADVENSSSDEVEENAVGAVDDDVIVLEDEEEANEDEEEVDEDEEEVNEDEDEVVCEIIEISSQ